MGTVNNVELVRLPPTIGSKTVVECDCVEKLFELIRLYHLVLFVQVKFQQAITFSQRSRLGLGVEVGGDCRQMLSQNVETLATIRNVGVSSENRRSHE